MTTRKPLVKFTDVDYFDPDYVIAVIMDDEDEGVWTVDVLFARGRHTLSQDFTDRSAAEEALAKIVYLINETRKK